LLDKSLRFSGNKSRREIGRGRVEVHKPEETLPDFHLKLCDEAGFDLSKLLTPFMFGEAAF